MSFLCLNSTIARFTTAFLLDTFTVQAFTVASDGSGGNPETWADQTTGVAGLLEQSQFRPLQEPILGAHQQEIRRWGITLKQGTIVDASNRIKQTHSSGVVLTTPRYFKILSMTDGETFDIATSCECEELPNLS